MVNAMEETALPASLPVVLSVATGWLLVPFDILCTLVNSDICIFCLLANAKKNGHSNSSAIGEKNEASWYVDILFVFGVGSLPVCIRLGWPVAN